MTTFFDRLPITNIGIDYGAMSHNIPGSLMDNPGKFDRCVKEVSKDADVNNAYAVCNKSVGGKKKRR